ncbi:unnamed protein product [Ectocarpus sp. 4 AP-2014]
MTEAATEPAPVVHDISDSNATRHTPAARSVSLDWNIDPSLIFCYGTQTQKWRNRRPPSTQPMRK